MWAGIDDFAPIELSAPALSALRESLGRASRKTPKARWAQVLRTLSEPTALRGRLERPISAHITPCGIPSSAGSGARALDDVVRACRIVAVAPQRHVRHKTFGEGSLVAEHPTERGLVYEVRFHDGVRKIRSEFVDDA